jgi:heat shock protein HslJ
VPDTLEISALFADSRISGSAGCNRYFAAIENTEPYTLSIGTPGSTRMMCPQSAMDLEMRYLSLLQKSNRFGFSFARLVLYYEDEDKYDRLLFTDRLSTAVQRFTP